MKSNVAKVGDIVKLPQHRGEISGVVVDDTCETGWLDILLEDGELVKWPTVQLKIVHPDELSDEQLEDVHGGMSSQDFENWRVEFINESR